MPSTQALFAAIFTVTAVCSSLSAAEARAQSDGKVLAAIGDSISSATNSQRLGDNRDLSWSTGTKTESKSHLKKLTALLGQNVVGRNEAVAGSVAADLGPQIDRVLAQRPDYLTITIGANDVCSWDANHRVALETFGRTLEGHIQRIIAARPGIKIYLASIPDMYNLWEIAHDRSGCQMRWDLFNICSALLGSDVTELERQGFVGRWRDANDLIETIADRFADNVFYDPAMANTHFEWQHVSGIDCFHPSIAGQNLISEKTWESGWLTD